MTPSSYLVAKDASYHTKNNVPLLPQGARLTHSKIFSLTAFCSFIPSSASCAPSAWRKRGMQKRFSGWMDIDLTEKGRNQATQAGKLLALHGFESDEAHASLLKRAVRTLWTALHSSNHHWIPVTFLAAQRAPLRCTGEDMPRCQGSFQITQSSINNVLFAIFAALQTGISKRMQQYS